MAKNCQQWQKRIEFLIVIAQYETAVTSQRMKDIEFPENPRWPVALLMIGACVGAVAISAVFVLLGVVRLVSDVPLVLG